MRGSSRKFGVRSAHFTSSHASSSCAHVVCLILRDSLSCYPLSLLSSCSYTLSSASSSTVWWTNSLCTSANEDLSTHAEYDPLTFEKTANRMLRYPDSDDVKVGVTELQEQLERKVEQVLPSDKFCPAGYE